MPKPVRSLDQGRPLTQGGIGQSDAVFCRAESDLLVQMNYPALQWFTRGLRLLGKCSILVLETVKLETHINRFGRVSYRSDGDHVRPHLDVVPKILSRNTPGHLDQKTFSKPSYLK
jgi:hypothetical protein